MKTGRLVQIEIIFIFVLCFLFLFVAVPLLLKMKSLLFLQRTSFKSKQCLSNKSSTLTSAKIGHNVFS